MGLLLPMMLRANHHFVFTLVDQLGVYTAQ